MRLRRVALVAVAASALVTVARSGHELPVYPSYYPHEIAISAIAPDEAGAMLRDARIHAYVGPEPRVDPPADAIRAVESLGAFVVVRVNPASPRAADEASACALAGAIVRDLAARGAPVIAHPYPVTPFHGDYLYHVDRVEAAKVRWLKQAASDVGAVRVRAGEGPAKSLVRPEWVAAGDDWDAEILAIDAATLVRANTLAINGWTGPPWLRAGWYQAQLVLGANNAKAGELLQRLQDSAHANAVERINLERDLVATLTSSCRAVVAGYTVKRHASTADFSNGIENIAFDALEGLNSPMFIRTVKLKDFPWNGSLSLGVDSKPAAAWNPVAGFTDPFGRLMWSAVGDTAMIPQPYDASWMLNRASNADAVPRR
jgi:hypothetical protein